MTADPNDPLPIPLDLLAHCLRQVSGGPVDLRGWTSLGGGTRKTVHRLDTTSGALVLLTWGNRPDYFGEQASADPVREACRYATNTRVLRENGVRVPRTLYYLRFHSWHPFKLVNCAPFALVEHVRVQTFHEALRAGKSAPELLPRMREQLERMHALRRDHPGSLLGETAPRPPHEDAYTNALAELSDLAGELPAVRARQAAIAGRLEGLRKQILPRGEYCLVHGELGPDEHFLVDDSGAVVLLDVDNCEYHDLEREHAYLRIRFGEHYPALSCPGLDPQRMEFYTLCLHLSIAWGHRRLYTRGYPDPDSLREIYERHISRALDMVT